MVEVANIYNASQFGSPDPAGLSYDPITGKLLLVDSEVDEKPFFSDTNMFAVDPDNGSATGYALTSVTDEPTGVAFDPATGKVFVTDDDTRMVYEVDRNDPTTQISAFSAAAIGVANLEDIAAAPNGNLFLLDEFDRSIVEVTASGGFVSKFTMPDTIKRPEAIAYDAKNDVFYVGGGWSADIFKVSHGGAILDKITVLRNYRNADGSHAQPKGLALVNGDDGSVSLWVADYGQDQAADGRLFEIILQGPPPPLTASISGGTPEPQLEQTGAQIAFNVSLSRAATEDVVVTYATVDGTAKGGSDFTAVSSGTITIAAGATSGKILVDLINDSTVESSESFGVKILSAKGAVSGDPVQIVQATGTGDIVDDDQSVPKVLVYDATTFGSTDPAGLTYMPTRDSVLLVDSEVDEKPFFSDTNMFRLKTDGTFSQGYHLTTLSKEPTGVAYWQDPSTHNEYLFITDDERSLVYKVALANPTVALSQFSTSSLGAIDVEDVTVDPNTGNLYLIGEATHTIYETTQTGELLSTIVLPSTISNPEAIAYDPDADRFYVSGYFSKNIFVVSHQGAILQTIKDLGDYPHADGSRVVPKGLDLVPDDDGQGLSLWVADYGKDQVADGRILVMDLPDPDPLIA